MADQIEAAKITWRDGDVPVAARFDDPYFSLNDGLAETRHVFLDGNDLPERFAAGFHVAELGFGTGLNLLAVWALWEQSGQSDVLTFTSFEAFPMQPGDMARALSAWPDLAPWRERFLAVWDGQQAMLPTLQAKVLTGDVRETLRQWDGKADAWFLDGFSPAKNPEMWEPPLLAQVAGHTNAEGTFATYTAAGHVRRALQDAGFKVQRTPGYGRKRHMTRGVRR